MEKYSQSGNAADLPKFLAGQLLEFPAYVDAKTIDSPPEDLFQLIADAYENDQLTEEQELIFEAMLYLYNLTEEFDLRRAVLIWEDEDFLQFQTALVDARLQRA